MNPKQYSIDESRVFGLADGETDPSAPDSVWVPVVSASRDECENPDSKIDAIRYVTARGNGAGSSIDRTSGPFVDDGRKAPVNFGNDPSNSGMVGQEHYFEQIAKQRVAAAKGTPLQFVAFHRVRRVDLI